MKQNNILAREGFLDFFKKKKKETEEKQEEKQEEKYINIEDTIEEVIKSLVSCDEQIKNSKNNEKFYLTKQGHIKSFNNVQDFINFLEHYLSFLKSTLKYYNKLIVTINKVAANCNNYAKKCDKLEAIREYNKIIGNIDYFNEVVKNGFVGDGINFKDNFKILNLKIIAYKPTALEEDDLRNVEIASNVPFIESVTISNLETKDKDFNASRSDCLKIVKITQEIIKTSKELLYFHNKHIDGGPGFDEYRRITEELEQIRFEASNGENKDNYCDLMPETLIYSCGNYFEDFGNDTVKISIEITKDIISTLSHLPKDINIAKEAIYLRW